MTSRGFNLPEFPPNLPRLFRNGGREGAGGDDWVLASEAVNDYEAARRIAEEALGALARGNFDLAIERLGVAHERLAEGSAAGKRLSTNLMEQVVDGPAAARARDTIERVEARIALSCRQGQR